MPASLRAGDWIRDDWYVACLGHEMRERPIGRTLLGTPLALFRDGDGRAAAVLDRCPHRSAPLSIGAVRGGRLECAYHGWKFDAAGICREVPGLCGPHEGRARRVPSFAVVEQEGFVWVFAVPDTEPRSAPFRLSDSVDKTYTSVRKVVDVHGSLFATLENTLDAVHTAYVHRGIFRGGREPVEVKVVVTRAPDGFRARYIGEPSPPGIAVRILAPGGGVLEHEDRFILPSIAQVDYRLGDTNHFVVTSICTPIDEEHTRIYATISLKLRIPARLVLPILSPFAWKIFHQDARILDLQTDTIRRTGEESFVSTEIDVLGTEIRRLLKHGRRATADAGESSQRREIRMRL
jgi:phenylpropionate dioxygenase-like ring-hydroxylating dioxygenase large terminal subunit